MSAVEASHFVREMIHTEARGPGDYERQAQRLLRQAELAQAVQPNDDVAAIQREIQALQSRLAAAKGEAKGARP